MAIFSTEIHTPHTNKTQITESILHRNQHAITYRVKNHKIVSLQSEAPSCWRGERETGAFSGRLPGGGGIPGFGCLHLQPFNFGDVSEGDNEHFSVNCSFWFSLASSLPLPASAEIPGPPETRTSLSATAPRANAAGKLPIPEPGKRTERGAIRGGRNEGGIVGGGGGRKPTEAVATGFCRRPEAQTPPSSFANPSLQPLLA